MCYRNLPSHRTGEYQMDFMSLFSLRLRVFAVNELRFLGSFEFMPDFLACSGFQLHGLTIGREVGVLDLDLVFAGG